MKKKFGRFQYAQPKVQRQYQIKAEPEEKQQERVEYGTEAYPYKSPRNLNWQ